MLKHALKPTQACNVPTAARTVFPVVGVALPRRSVKCRFQGSEEERTRRASDPYSSTTNRPTSGGYGYSAGYSEDDPMEGVREYFKDLKQKWDDWPAENRNASVIYGSGAVVVLYIANAVLDSIERVPLIPGLLKFVGLIYSSWFIYRYLLFADGREDLSRDITLDKLFGRAEDEAKDLGKDAQNAWDRVKKTADTNTSSSSRTSRGTAAYGASELDTNVSKALHDMEKIADELSD